jgi:7-dehydrocholesterol reductase
MARTRRSSSKKSPATPKRGATPEKAAKKKRSAAKPKGSTPRRGRSKTPTKEKSAKKRSAKRKRTALSGAGEYNDGTNWVAAGIEDNAFLFGLVLVAPFLTILLGYLTSPEFKDTGMDPHLSVMVPACFNDVGACALNLFEKGASVFPPTYEAWRFLVVFMGLAFALEWLPGRVETGPETLTGHIPKYVDNGVLHCLASTLLFYAGSNLGPYGLWDFGIIYDVFPTLIAALNIFGVLFCAFLTYKGLHFPSTADSGSSGSIVKDYLWGTELYPRIRNWDLKRFINCRFSMTFWQLAGLSFAYKSYTLHGKYDYGLIFAALSQYLYLFKFFLWEMGYMRSIDIIVDRAGFEIQWGCLCYVPAVYTLHSRFCVQYPSQLTLPVAGALFVLSMAGVVLNYAADRERDVFRATEGKALVWGKKPDFIKAKYTIVDRNTGKKKTKTSLLLASGFWGVARHLQYSFELTAAWSWCLLANPFVNGVIPLFYAAFLTYLLIDRANRDSKKCHLKYGKYYEEYCRRVPYKIIPGIY